MASKLIRTTIMLPEDLVIKAKAEAIRQKKSVSSLIRTALEQKIRGDLPKTLKVVDPMSTLGKYKLGSKRIYKKRSELYEDVLKEYAR